MRKICASLAMAALLLLASACRTTESPEKQMNDATITASVKAKLASDLGLSTVTNVSVNVTNGVVTLAGQVNSAESKRRAGEIARNVEKVVSVNNMLQVGT